MQSASFVLGWLFKPIATSLSDIAKWWSLRADIMRWWYGVRHKRWRCWSHRGGLDGIHSGALIRGLPWKLALTLCGRKQARQTSMTEAQATARATALIVVPLAVAVAVGLRTPRTGQSQSGSAASSAEKSEEAGPEPAAYLYDKQQTPIFWSDKNKKLYFLDKRGSKHDLKLSRPKDGSAVYPDGTPIYIDKKSQLI